MSNFMSKHSQTFLLLEDWEKTRKELHAYILLELLKIILQSHDLYN